MKESRYPLPDGALERDSYRHGDSNPGTDPARNDRRHCVYIFRNADREVLYVGLTCRFGERVSSHKAEKGWWLEVDCVDIEHFPTRDEARARELILIRELDPPHNIEGRSKVDRWGCDECDGTDVVLLTWGSQESEISSFAGGRPELCEPDFVADKGRSFLFCYGCMDYCDVAIRRVDGTEETVRGVAGFPSVAERAGGGA